MVNFIYCQVFVCFCVVITRGQTPCSKIEGKPGCVCATDDGIIDLTSIANNDGTPRFTGIIGQNLGYTYSYNPCFGYSDGTTGCFSETKTIAACQDEKSWDQQYSCGDIATETLMLNNIGNNELQYSGGENGRQSSVELVCDKTVTTPKLDAYDDSNEGIFYYKFKLTTMCACPGLCNDVLPGSGTAAGEIGIILIVLTLVGFGLYFAIGAVIRRFMMLKEGRDIIPHYNFWTGLIYLIKDGFMFVFRPIADKFSKNQSTKIKYDQL